MLLKCKTVSFNILRTIHVVEQNDFEWFLVVGFFPMNVKRAGLKKRRNIFVFLKNI